MAGKEEAEPHHGHLDDTAVDRLAARHPLHHENASSQAWIDRVLPAARDVREKWNIPVSVTIAQGAVESQWGAIHPGNEYFGIKGHAPDGASRRLHTHEAMNGHRHPETDSFRSYASLHDAADDYGRFLNTQPRFKTALEHTDDPRRFVQEIGKAHYATDPHYAAKVTRIIDQHGLTKYDAAPERVIGSSPHPGSANPDRSPTAQPGMAAPFDARSHWLEMAKRGHEAAAARLTTVPSQEPSTIPAPAPKLRLKQ